MALKKNLKDLPVAEEPKGRPVAERLLLGEALSAGLLRWRASDHDDPHAGGEGKVWNSWAAKCGKDVEYRVRGIPPKPEEVSSLWNFALGSWAHEFLQAATLVQFPDAAIEAVHIHPSGRAGHMDIGLYLYTPELHRVAIEAKTIGGFGFKMAVKEQGPRPDHVLQGALNAMDFDADLMVIAYLAKENVGMPYADSIFGRGHDPIRRSYAEWHFTREEWEPLAKAEHARLTRIASTEHGERSSPSLPAGAQIVDPRRGTWEVREDFRIIDSGHTWMCDYCGFRDRCIEDLGKE